MACPCSHASCYICAKCNIHENLQKVNKLVIRKSYFITVILGTTYMYIWSTFVSLKRHQALRETMDSETLLTTMKLVWTFRIESIANLVTHSSLLPHDLISSLLAINMIEENWNRQASLRIVYEARLNIYLKQIKLYA
jgi:hypothetical protein